MIMTSSVGTIKRKDNGAQFESLDEYLKIAEKQIKFFGKRYFPDFMKKLLDSEEAISHIAYANMMADWKYDDKLNCSKRTYRNNWAIGLMKNLYTKYRKHYKKYGRTQYLSDILCMGENGDDFELEDLLGYNNPPDKILEEKEEIERLESLMGKVLSSRNKEILLMHKKDGRTMSEISDKYSISKQRVEQIISKSVSVLKEFIDE